MQMSNQIIEIQNLNFSYNRQPVLKDVNLNIQSGDFMAMIGPNGGGKTTLLKLLAGKLPPQTGKTIYHPGIKRGFFEQTNVKSLVDSRTVEEEILYSQPDIDRQRARNICGAMMFSGDEALKKIGVLSGGEKSRVMLGRLLVTPVNLLLLDEPTTGLDPEARRHDEIAVLPKRAGRVGQDE